MELTASFAAARTMSAEEKKAMLCCWYEEYGTMILRTCCLYLGSRADAEDAMQETMLKAWRYMERFCAREGGYAKAWLMRIALNTCRDMLRAARRRQQAALSEMEEMCAENGVSDGGCELLREVTMLPPSYKEAVLLYYYHGMTTAEAARVLRVSGSTVSRRLNAAVKMLKEKTEA